MDNAKLVYWMIKRELSPSELAAKIDVTPTYISNLRTGKKSGSLEVWKRIAEALGIELKELC